MEALSRLWAKSDGTTIREHTDKLLENMKLLRQLYGDLIENTLDPEESEAFWKALELACEYHDYGKMHCWFQKKVGNPDFKRVRTSLPEVRHNLLSPAFLPDIGEKALKTLVSLAILHHHDHESSRDSVDKVEKVLKEEFGKSLDLSLKRILRQSEWEAVKKLEEREGKEFTRFYTLLKGFLLRIDHASSSKHGASVESKRLTDNEERVKNYLAEKKNSQLNDLQKFVLENRENNLLVVASTGYGKTEAGFIFLKDKGFFTIPIRTSANAIFSRASEVFSEEDVGLLHSTAPLFLLENSESKRNFDRNTIVSDIFLTRNFAKPLIVSTPDQLFPFVFRPKGFEKFLSMFSYSRAVIDEIQLFEPHTLGFLVKAIEKAHEIGGKIMVMTATLPSYVRRDLQDIEFREGRFITESTRHNIKLIPSSITSEGGLSLIKKLSERGKVLVITNTRTKALGLKKALREGEVIHSWFIQKDRKKREEDIKGFFDSEEKGLWITTQIAEVSLDLDADFLVTELSTADSLLQRMGRVNRKGLKPTDEPNVFVFTEESSGIGGVYRKSIHEITKEKLREGLIDEEWKLRFVEEVYSALEERDREYISKYEKAKRYIDNLWILRERFFNKREAQEMFREILSEVVIPEVFKEEVEPLVEEYLREKDTIRKLELFSEILGYTFSLPYYWEVRLQPVKGLKGIFWASGDYSSETGFVEGAGGGNIL